MVNDIEHLFVYLLAICISSLEKYLLRSSAHFKINYFLLMSCMSSLYIYIILFNTFPLSAIWFTKLFSYFCLFSLLMVYFAVQKLFGLRSSYLFMFCFCCLFFWCQIWKIIAKTNVREITAYVFFWEFMVSVLTYKYLIHFDLIFVYVVI